MEDKEITIQKKGRTTKTYVLQAFVLDHDALWDKLVTFFYEVITELDYEDYIRITTEKDKS